MVLFDVIAGRKGFNQYVLIGRAVPADKLAEFLSGVLAHDQRAENPHPDAINYYDKEVLGKEVAVDVHLHPTFWNMNIDGRLDPALGALQYDGLSE